MQVHGEHFLAAPQRRFRKNSPVVPVLHVFLLDTLQQTTFLGCSPPLLKGGAVNGAAGSSSASVAFSLSTTQSE